ncbi:Gti1/Pac2 family-domain-containing protein [Dichomitus squalens]|uniref:Gti1/Pac2 family-domain-containing protein n=1 Tax=Dichomitus squalens TaxID=114155 RepID=A0A4Q9ME49_9APHY|nr:Gti1/Pac2 family-domain-containing protein [Dichomitus squalens]
MLVFEATRAGIVPRVTRRFHELEKREIIQSGAILVFTEEESGIKRWTDPYLWSASRMQGNFLMYREREDSCPEADAPYRCSAMTPLSDADDQEADSELEYYILGSWNKGKGLKKDGLMKKTTSMSIEDTTYHLVSYYYPSDVRSGLLRTPSSMPELACLEISPAMKLGFSHTRHLHASRGKRGRPPRSSRSGETSAHNPEVQVSPTSHSAPTSPVEVPSLPERSLYRHSSATLITTPNSSSSPSPRSRFHPYAHGNAASSPELTLRNTPNHGLDSGLSVSAKSQTPIAHDHPAFLRAPDSSCETWQSSPSALLPSMPIEEIRYMPTTFHLDAMFGPMAYQEEAYAHDAEAQQLLRTWEPIMAETRLMMLGSRPAPDALQYDPYRGGPSMYHR